MKSALRAVAIRARLLVLRVVSKSRVLMRLYFLCMSDFDREYEFSLCGRVQALSSEYRSDFSNANIRRCVHRLEKGLYHARRRLPFGESVVRELLSELRAVPTNAMYDQEEVAWLVSTLGLYLSLVPTSDAEACLLLAKGLRVSDRPSNHVPAELGSEFETVATLAKRRESIRFFDARPVGVGVLTAAVGVAKEAPSACNRQPFSLRLLTDRKDIDFVGSRAPGTGGFLEGIPTLAVVIGHASSFRHFRDRHLVYTDAGLFLGHLLLALEAGGVSSCVLNWTPDWEKDRAVIQYLGHDMSKTVVCLLALGYRADDVVAPTSIKKANDVLLRSSAFVGREECV